MTGRLNAMRRIAGLPAVENDQSFNENAQYGAVLVAASGRISHSPKQPDDMDDAFYERGLRAVSSCNLTGDVEGMPVSAIDGWMDDSDPSNITILGHRRWQLNPQLGQVGFGYYNGFTLESVFDESGEAVDYDFIGWPASGNFPTQLFSGSEAWSVTLNPEKYNWHELQEEDLTVTVKNSAGKTWTLKGGQDYSPVGSGAYFGLSKGGYGVYNCIIFRLDGVDKYEGVYTVTVQGAKDWYGNNADLTYQVEFFDANSGSLSDEKPNDQPDNNPGNQPQQQEISAFVTRLYETCLGRTPDKAGLESWVNVLESGREGGAQVAYNFVFSTEFKNKNYCNEDYIKLLYRAFLGREADAAGLSSWINVMESGTTREEVFNGFAMSTEFRGLCSQYGINIGSAIEVPQYGTIPSGPCSACGKEAPVKGFVTRLYQICLEREPDAAGLSSWINVLVAHQNSGRDVAYGFVFSDEFKGRNYSNTDYVKQLYRAFLGRESDPAGLESWVRLLDNGTSREEVFDGFVGSQEFTDICASYGIVRG